MDTNLPEGHVWNPQDFRWQPHDLLASRAQLGAGIAPEASYYADNRLLPGGSLVLQSSDFLTDSQLNRKSITCQVCSCGKNLEQEKSYYKRYRLCEDHLKMLSLVVDGRSSRFCQQCGRFHPLSEFDGDKRSCRARLQEHNARRRKKQTSRDTSRAPPSKRQHAAGKSKGSSGTDATQTTGKRARALPGKARKTEKRNNSEDSTCQMDTDDEASELVLERTRAPAAAAAVVHRATESPGSPDVVGSVHPLHRHTATPYLTAQDIPQQKLINDMPRSVMPLATGHGGSTLSHLSGLLDAPYAHHSLSTPALCMDVPDALDGFATCEPSTLGLLDEVLLARAKCEARSADEQIQNAVDLSMLKAVRLQQYDQQLGSMLYSSAMAPSSRFQQMLPQPQYQLPDTVGWAANPPMPSSWGQPYPATMQLSSEQLPLASTSEARQVKELLMTMTTIPKEQSLLERARAIQDLHLQAMDSSKERKLQGGCLRGNVGLPHDLASLYSLNGAAQPVAPDLGHGLLPSNQASSSTYQTYQLGASIPGGMPNGSMEQQSTLELARALLAGGGYEPQYQAPDALTRLSIKIYNCMPDQLPSNLRNNLMTALVSGSSLQHGYLRQGCVHLTVDVTAPVARGCPAQAALIASILGPGLLEQRKVLVQVGSGVVTLENGVITQQEAASAPVLAAVQPLALAAGKPCRVTLHGSHVCGEEVVVLARFQGQSVAVSVVERVVEDEAQGQGRVVVEVPALPRSGLLLLECQQGAHLSNWRPVLVADDAQVVEEVMQLQAQVAAGRVSCDMADHVVVDLGRILEFDDLAVAQFAVLATYHLQATQMASGIFTSNWSRAELTQNSSGSSTQQTDTPELHAGTIVSNGCEWSDGSSDDMTGCDIPAELAKPPHPLLAQPNRASVLHIAEGMLQFACRRGWPNTAGRLVGVLLSQGATLEDLLRAGADGLSLLHRCVQSGKEGMVREALEWTSGTGLADQWGCITPIGISPLHLAAAHSASAALGASILSSNTVACYLWLHQQAADGLRPADLAVLCGIPQLNELAYARLHLAAAVTRAQHEHHTASPQATDEQGSEVQTEESSGSGHTVFPGHSDGASEQPCCSVPPTDMPSTHMHKAEAGPSSSGTQLSSSHGPWEDEYAHSCAKPVRQVEDSGVSAESSQWAELELMAFGSCGIGPVGMAYLVCFSALSVVLLVCQLLLSFWGTCLLAALVTALQAALALRVPIVNKCGAVAARLRAWVAPLWSTYVPSFPHEQQELAYVKHMSRNLVQLDCIYAALLLAWDSISIAKMSDRGLLRCVEAWLSVLGVPRPWPGAAGPAAAALVPAMLPQLTVFMAAILLVAAASQSWYEAKREQLMLAMQVVLMLAMRGIASQWLGSTWQQPLLLSTAALLLPIAFRVRVRNQVWVAGWSVASSLMTAAVADTAGSLLLLRVGITTFGSLFMCYLLERYDRAAWFSRAGRPKRKTSHDLPSALKQHEE